MLNHWFVTAGGGNAHVPFLFEHTAACCGSISVCLSVARSAEGSDLIWMAGAADQVSAISHLLLHVAEVLISLSFLSVEEASN